MRFLSLITCFFWIATLAAQTTELSFPKDCFGVYKGDLQITSAKGNQTIQMEFHLQATDTVGNYKYVLVYVVDGNRQERHYNLIEKDIERGQFVVDENNGILLDATLVGNKLYSMFEVQGNILNTTETFFKDKMLFEITFSSKKQKNETGTEDGIKVFSYPVTTVQKATLYKVEN